MEEEDYKSKCEKEMLKQQKQKESSKRYYEKNKESKLEYQKKYRQEHKDEINNYVNNYNKEIINCPVCNKKLKYGSLGSHKKRKHNNVI